MRARSRDRPNPIAVGSPVPMTRNALPGPGRSVPRASTTARGGWLASSTGRSALSAARPHRSTPTSSAVEVLAAPNDDGRRTAIGEVPLRHAEVLIDLAVVTPPDVPPDTEPDPTAALFAEGGTGKPISSDAPTSARSSERGSSMPAAAKGSSGTNATRTSCRPRRTARGRPSMRSTPGVPTVSPRRHLDLGGAGRPRRTQYR